MDSLIFAGACIVGLATGLFPGLHVNTLAAITIAAVPLSPTWALALVAVGTVHTVVSILPATYLGAPGEDTALAVLPAHAMLQQGRAPEAVRLSVVASVQAMMLVVLFLLPVKWVLAQPLQLAPLLNGAAMWILLGVLLLLLWQERHRGWRGQLMAALVIALSGWLGWLAWSWPVGNPWVPASPLLPLLSGLFGVPGLLYASQASLPTQVAPPPRIPAKTTRLVFGATMVAAATAVLPGLTAAVATAIARVGRADGPRPIIATLSAVNTAHHGFALCMLWIVGTTRSGLADAIRPQLRIREWNGAMPADLHAVLWVALAATVVGAVGTLVLERPMRRALPHLPSRPLHLGAAAVITTIVALLTGVWGLALFVAAIGVGLVPLAYGIRRVHLAACLIVPVVITRL